MSNGKGRVNVTLISSAIGTAFVLVLFLTAHAYLKPKSISQPQYIADTATHKAVVAMKSVVDVCISQYDGGQQDDCKELKRMLEILQSSLDLAAQTSMSQSTFGLLNIGYWQYIVTGFTAILLFVAVVQTWAILVEANKTTQAAHDTLEETKQANILQLKPYLSFHLAEFEISEVSDTFVKVNIEIEVTNFGKTPITGVTLASMHGLRLNSKIHGRGRAAVAGSYAAFTANQAGAGLSYFGYLAPKETRFLTANPTLEFSSFYPLRQDRADFSSEYFLGGVIQFIDISTGDDTVRGISFYCASAGYDNHANNKNSGEKEKISAITADYITERRD